MFGSIRSECADCLRKRGFRDFTKQIKLRLQITDDIHVSIEDA